MILTLSPVMPCTVTGESVTRMSVVMAELCRMWMLAWVSSSSSVSCRPVILDKYIRFVSSLASVEDHCEGGSSKRASCTALRKMVSSSSAAKWTRLTVHAVDRWPFIPQFQQTMLSYCAIEPELF